MPMGSAKGPVGIEDMPDGFEMGTASNRDPFCPVTCGWLITVSKCILLNDTKNLRFFMLVAMFFLFVFFALILGSKGTNC